MCYLFSCTLLNPYIYVIWDRLAEIKANHAWLIYTIRPYCVKIYLLVSDLPFFEIYSSLSESDFNSSSI